jgi:hypothetical protein
MGSDQQFYDFNCLFGNEFHELLPKLNDVFLFLLQRNSYPDILQSFFIILFVLN